MRFAVLSSGSSGNAMVVASNNGAVLADCGLSLRELERRAASVDFNLADLTAILVTHEHEDHIGGVGVVARAYQLPVYATYGTLAASNGRLDGVETTHAIGTERSFELAGLEIHPVIVPHDAREPSQFVFQCDGRRLGLLTDLGHATPHLERSYGELDALVLEFNHEPELLSRSPYPQTLKSRIEGPYGHLSNDASAMLLQRLDRSRLKVLIAAHLSEKTNTPALVNSHLERLALNDVQCLLARQEESLPWIDVH